MEILVRYVRGHYTILTVVDLAQVIEKRKSQGKSFEYYVHYVNRKPQHI